MPYTEDVLWNYALVGEKGNTVLSIWSMKDWKIQHTLEIGTRHLEEGGASPQDRLLVSVDPRARMMVVFSRETKFLFLVTFEVRQRKRVVEDVAESCFLS